MKKNQIVLIRVVSVAILMAAKALILIFGAGSTVFTKIIQDYILYLHTFLKKINLCIKCLQKFILESLIHSLRL